MSDQMERLLIELAEVLERHNGASIGVGQDSDTLVVGLPIGDDYEETEVVDIPVTIDALTIAHAIDDARSQPPL